MVYRSNNLPILGDRPARTNFHNPAEVLLSRLEEGIPGATLVEKAAALNSQARKALTPILARLDSSDSNAKKAIMDELYVAIEQLDKAVPDGIEDGHYGEIRKSADSRYDGAPIED